MKTSSQDISLWDIDIRAGRPILSDYDELVDLLTMVGCSQVPYLIRKRNRYRLAKDVLPVRMNPSQPGRPMVPALVLEVKDLHEEIAEIDQRLGRPDLPEQERADYVRHRQFLLDALPPRARSRYGPGQARGEKAHKKPSAPASGAGSKNWRNPCGSPEPVLIATEASCRWCKSPMFVRISQGSTYLDCGCPDPF